jgi:acetyltransferase-like isoleucine patch superfamily enzyme
MWSVTYRALMRKHYGVDIGIHSYGPGLFPGKIPAGTQVGNYCSLAAGLHVLRRNHPVDRISQHPFFFNVEAGLLDHDTIPDVVNNPLRIGHDIWIGQNVMITPGCRCIGDSAVIAAGAVVTSDVLPFAIMGGVPAKIIRWRLSEELRAEWVATQWWLNPVSELADRLDQFTTSFRPDGHSGVTVNPTEKNRQAE